MQHTNNPGKGVRIRPIVTTLIVGIVIPITLFFGTAHMTERKYYIISLLVIIYAMLPFFIAFEKRRPKARELVIIAVLSALAIASRTAFFMVPQFKPMGAIVIISGVCLGAEGGFLVGAISAFISNMLFGQGPWTPWQMFGFGIMGLLAALLFKTGIFSAKRIPLSLFGSFLTYFVYGGIVNTGVLMMTNLPLSLSGLISVFTTSFMFDITHAAATGIFLFLIAEPMIEKLERIRTKYGLVE